jgi:hypothetical protein
MHVRAFAYESTQLILSCANLNENQNTGGKHIGPIIQKAESRQCVTTDPIISDSQLGVFVNSSFACMFDEHVAASTVASLAAKAPKLVQGTRS